MGKIFAKPKPAPIAPVATTPVPAAPERTDDETQALADEQRRKLNQNTGRSSTFLTQGGVDAGSAAVRFLGGAART